MFCILHYICILFHFEGHWKRTLPPRCTERGTGTCGLLQINQSGKFKNLYLDQHNADDSPSPSRLKPLCPTRWLSRGAAVRAALDNYADVVGALDEASSTFGNTTAGRANLIHSLLTSAKCVLGLVASLPLIECLEKFNASLQGVGTTVAGMLAAAVVVRENLRQIRDDVECEFGSIFQAAAEHSHQ